MVNRGLYERKKKKHSRPAGGSGSVLGELTLVKQPSGLVRSSRGLWVCKKMGLKRIMGPGPKIKLK